MSKEALNEFTFHFDLSFRLAVLFEFLNSFTHAIVLMMLFSYEVKDRSPSELTIVSKVLCV